MERKVNIPMALACVLLCLTLITTHMTGGLFARYTTTAQASDSARVAKFSILGGKSDDVTITCGQGDEGSYTITVDNQSEVAVTYGISIQFDEAFDSDKLGVTLKQGENVEQGTLSDDKKTMEYGTLGSLAPGGQQAYTLTFTVKEWAYVTVDATDPTMESVSKTLSFTVNIHAEQID